MIKTIIFIISFVLLASTELLSQDDSDQHTFIAQRPGYFKATLVISKDSSYQYNESNHKGQKLKDAGRLSLQNGSYYLNSTNKTRRTSSQDQSKGEPFYKFNMQKIEYSTDKITLVPCDSIIPEVCTFRRRNK
jgi:glucan-binding YG repeat protein